MQKYLALTNVDSLDPLPALGARLLRGYEKPVETKINAFREFETQKFELNDEVCKQVSYPGDFLKALAYSTASCEAVKKFNSDMNKLVQKTCGTPVTKAQVLEARGKAAARVGMPVSRLNDLWAKHCEEKRLGGYKDSANEELYQQARDFFNSLGKTVLVSDYHAVIAASEGASTEEDPHDFYAQARAAVLGRLGGPKPTPEQYGAMLTWIESHA
jgi:hypothetical protein